MRNILLALLLTIGLTASEVEIDERTTFEKITFKSKTPLTQEELERRVIYTNIAASGLALAWGTAFWDYFSISPVTAEEGWFAEDTKYGGADKVGHIYSTYIFSLGFSTLYEYWGLEEEKSMVYGPLSAWIFQAMMEAGDSFSETQGFSYEDIVMNTVGALFYYVREKYPEVKNKLDLRMEYLPAFRDGDEDIFTQYNNKKYLLALKLSGFKSMESTILKYGEFHLGYYTRGYKNSDEYTQKERIAYVGIGINVAEVLKTMGWSRTSKIFNYLQLPYTSVPFGYDYNSQEYVAPYSRPYHGYHN
ncbi:MAG: DUF2279 domain-containing protein [Campylobacterota bacterium]|nr:DUF2279 domain-containing protein [Campylobacterota bacterium]